MKDDFFNALPVEKDVTPEKIVSAELSARMDLVNFVRGQLQYLNARDDALDTAIRTLMERIETDGESVTSGTLVKLIEVLNKGKNDRIGALFQFLKPQNQLNQQPTNPPPGPSNPNQSDNGISREEVKVSKNLLNFLEKVAKQSEEKETELHEET